VQALIDRENFVRGQEVRSGECRFVVLGVAVAVYVADLSGREVW
jgi:hypothetical protein